MNNTFYSWTAKGNFKMEKLKLVLKVMGYVVLLAWAVAFTFLLVVLDIVLYTIPKPIVLLINQGR